MKKYVLRNILTLLFLLLKNFVYCQLVVQGPTCVVNGIEYQYSITGNNTSGQPARFCVSGGKISNSSSSCIDTLNVSSVRITWQDDYHGNISLSANAGTSSLAVTINKPLQAGTIDSSSKMQYILTGTIPNSVNCGPASGGGCDPMYQYQWQQSQDNINWVDIPQATSPNLAFSSGQKQTGYYRRMVKEMKSNSIAYSRSVLVAVMQPGTTH